MSNANWADVDLAVHNDVFYERGTELGGEYVSLMRAANAAGNVEAEAFWQRQHLALRDERAAVRSGDREQIVTAMNRWDTLIDMLRHARAARPVAA